MRQFDQRIRLPPQVTAARDDPPDPTLTQQSLLTLVRQRISGIRADDEDQNDHETLRSDPVFKLGADRLPEGPDRARPPTRAWFENAVSIPDRGRLRDVLVDLFIPSFDEASRHLRRDRDAFDDPAHGQQPLSMFHGSSEQDQYQAIVITCVENDMVLRVGRRHGTCHAARGADNDRRYLAGRRRALGPDVPWPGRGDSGLGVPRRDEVGQERRLTSTFGIGLNSRLRGSSDDLVKEALEHDERTGQLPRSFLRVESQAASWPAPPPVVIQVEAPAHGTNRRAGVTHRPGCQVLPPAVYDEDARRGESANRNNELKTERPAERLSDHRVLANVFRLSRHAAALNLGVRWRHAVVPSPPSPAARGRPAELPTEVSDEPDGKRFFNTRRERDPLGQGFAWTWRRRRITVAAEVITRARRGIVRLSGSWPHLDHFRQVGRAVTSLPPAPPSPGSAGTAVAPRGSR